MATKNQIAPRFVLQWHLTAKCPNQCLHCYVPEDPTYQRELKNELGTRECKRVIDDFVDSFGKLNLQLEINFTGGDPLLRKDILDLITYARKKGVEVGILGNPNFITTKIAKKLKDLEINNYQISIDGMEKTHDYLRNKKGAFKDAIRALRILNNESIRTLVMFTLSKINAEEIFDVIDLVGNEGVSVFDFARLVPIGSGKELKNQMFTPQEYRNILLKIFDKYREMERKKVKTRYGRKDHLWKLLYYDLGIMRIFNSKDETIYGGCAIGSHLLTILADGSVLSCRRLPIEIGRVPEQKLWDIFTKSKKMTEFRKLNKFEKCAKCELLRYCRGCPAVSCAVNGSYFSPDPQCWKEVKKNGSKN